jgi:hypothetical protein
MEPEAPMRLRRLPAVNVSGRRIPLASSLTSRLLGLALLRRDRAGPGLMLPNCRSVHTFGMFFALDFYFFDEHGRLIRTAAEVVPGRLLFERRASHILEVPSGRAALHTDRQSAAALAAALSGRGASRSPEPLKDT